MELWVSGLPERPPRVWRRRATYPQRERDRSVVRGSVAVLEAASWCCRSRRCRSGGSGGRAGRWSSWRRRTFGDATTLDRRVAQVRVTDPHHPLYGKCFPVSDRRSGRGPRLIVIRLPDGRERGISRSATAPTSASDDLVAAAPSCQVHISVRTLLPLANHVRAVLASRHADLKGGGGRDLDQMCGKAGREMLPRLWPQVPMETQRQLAQQVGQLVQRLRRRVRSEEGHRAEHDIVD